MLEVILNIIVISIVVVHIWYIRKAIKKVDEHIEKLDMHLEKVDEHIDYIKYGGV